MKTGTVIFLTVHVALISVLLSLWLGSEFELQWLYPFALLFTSYREETLAAWQKYGQVNTNILRPPSPIPEILAKDYNYEVLKAASNNFRHAVVVRGLFANTVALEKWKTEDYLPTKLGGYTIPIVRNAVVGTLQDDRVLVDFEPSFRELFQVNYTRQYLFFPVKSRFTFNGSDAGRAAELQEACDKLCIEDLDLNRIWRGFGTKRHTSFAGSQFVIGKSTDTFTNKSTGSDWHCAAGNNWFIQAAGRKRWDFVEPKHSALMTPLKGGFFNMWTGNKNIAAVQKHIPTKFTILEEGDLLYNPDWQWHKVTNYGGLSIGVPIRERNFTLMFQNNPYFSSIVALNTALNKLTGLDLGGFPPPSAATEADNF